MTRIAIAEKMGMGGDWVRLKATWNETKSAYDFEMDTGDGVWKPYPEDDSDFNVVSIRYHGGPKDGQVEY